MPRVFNRVSFVVDVIVLRPIILICLWYLAVGWKGNKNLVEFTREESNIKKVWKF